MFNNENDNQLEDEKNIDQQESLDEQNNNIESNSEKIDDELTIEEKLIKLEDEIADLKDQRLRAVAELENFRKRAEKEQSDALKYGITNFAKEVITIKDNIERANQSINDELKNNEQFKAVIDGINLISSSFDSVFEKFQISKIDAINQKFDHNLHQAMMEIESDEVEPGTILQEHIPGYLINDRLLRPSMVGVSKAKQNQEKSEQKIDNEALSEKKD